MISSVNVKPEGNLDTYDFNVAYKKVHEDYSNLYFELKSSDKIIIINFELIVKDKIEMEIT